MPRPPRGVADSGRSGRGRRPASACGAAAGGAGRPAERADDAAGDRVVDELDRLPCRHEAERAGRDVALHRAHALGEAAELLEAEAHERAGLVVCLPDQLCHGSMYLHIG